jgi:hypothetical protein
LKTRTDQENIDLIEGDTCPNCLGDLDYTGGWGTSWGEESSAYTCEKCASEFTLTRYPDNRVSVDYCIV